jgi:hypothetical protein
MRWRRNTESDANGDIYTTIPHADSDSDVYTGIADADSDSDSDCYGIASTDGDADTLGYPASADAKAKANTVAAPDAVRSDLIAE